VSTSRTLFTVDGAVAFLTFNRPEARNAMTWDMYEALLEACDRVDRTEAVRVFVLRAEGKAFIAGTDISQFSRFASREDAVAFTVSDSRYTAGVANLHAQVSLLGRS